MLGIGSEWKTVFRGWSCRRYSLCECVRSNTMSELPLLLGTCDLLRPVTSSHPLLRAACASETPDECSLTFGHTVKTDMIQTQSAGRNPDQHHICRGRWVPTHTHTHTHTHTFKSHSEKQTASCNDVCVCVYQTCWRTERVMPYQWMTGGRGGCRGTLWFYMLVAA